VLFGFAGMIRPMACFALAGLALALLRDGQWRPMVVVVLAATATFALEVLLLQRWTGNALRGVHVYASNPGAYGGHLLGWPFQSLLSTPAHDGASPGRIAYIWIHVTIILLACAMIGVTTAGSVSGRKKRGRGRFLSSPFSGSLMDAETGTGTVSTLARTVNPRDSVSCGWLIGNTAFVLCIGSVWGFRHFPRFTIPAAPALFWTLRHFLPRKPQWWLLIAAGCGVMAVFGVINSP